MKLTISILCFLSFCLVTLAMQKRVQELTEEENAEGQEELRRLKGFLVNFLGAGLPLKKRTLGVNDSSLDKLWEELYNDISSLYKGMAGKDLTAIISQFTTCVNNVKTAVLRYIGNPSIIQDRHITNALKLSDDSSLTALEKLKKIEDAKALVGHVEKIIKAYKDEKTRRATPTAPEPSKTPVPEPPETPVPVSATTPVPVPLKTPAPVTPTTTTPPVTTTPPTTPTPSVRLGAVVVSLVIGLFVGVFLIGPALRVQGPSSGTPVRKRAPKGTKKGTRKGTKKSGSGKGTKPLLTR